MIELTEHDRKCIAAVRTVEWALAHQREDHAETIYRAGLAAGIERAAQRVENGRFLHDDAPTARFARECAAAIRALVK